MLYLISFFVSISAWAQTVPSTGFDLKTEKTITIELKKGQPTLVVFLSSKCPCSLSHEIHLQELKQKFPEVHFIGIHSNSNETTAESAKHFKASPMDFPILQDQKSQWANEWKALKTPHVFLLNGEGHIVYKGGVTNSPVFASAKDFYLLDALTALKNHQPIKVSEGRTLGCFIER